MSQPTLLTATDSQSQSADRAATGPTRRAARVGSRARTRMLTDLVHAVLAPSAALKPLPLSKVYGVSTGTMREVLVELTAMRMVVRDPINGFRVAPANQNHFFELVGTATWLEEVALRESIVNGDHQWEDAVLGTHAALAQSPLPTCSATGNRLAEWEDHLLDFHAALASACRSSILSGYCAQLQQHLLRYRNLAASALEHHADERGGLLALRNAVLARDVDLAIETLRVLNKDLTHAVLKAGILY